MDNYVKIITTIVIKIESTTTIKLPSPLPTFSLYLNTIYLTPFLLGHCTCVLALICLNRESLVSAKSMIKPFLCTLQIHAFIAFAKRNNNHFVMAMDSLCTKPSA